MMQPQYTLSEEIAHAITHGIGAVLSIVGLAVLVACASLYGDVWHITTCSIFGASLIVLYTASTLYHSVTHPQVKEVLRQVDYAAIFLLIAGTYTPFLLVNLRAGWGWPLFALVWGIAATGIVVGVLTRQRLERLSLILYLGLGWLAVIAIQPLILNVEPGGLWLLLIGGMFYTAGVVFFLADRIPFNHAIWHGFVLAGSASHFFAVLYYVIPAGA